MHYCSTRDRDLRYGFAEAVIDGLAPDGGLFVPSEIPGCDMEMVMEANTLAEMASLFLMPFVQGSIDPQRLEEICEDAFNFEIPLIEVEDGIYALELFHGPTLAFKDVGARFMGRVLPECNSYNEEITVLVATSGDTGGAVASGLFNVEGVRVVVLYPEGKVSPLQEKQFASLGGNVQALAVDGVFDDCQRLVKAAFRDSGITGSIRLTTANSINIARWIPQAIYYLWTLRQLGGPAIFSVPSGNFGNFTAGVLAWRSGLPVSHFMAACNANDTVPQYLLSGLYEPAPSIQTVANAMDVGDPSNFERLTYLFDDDYDAIKDITSGWSYSDAEICEMIVSCLDDNQYLLDPHGACGYKALKESKSDMPGVFLATAHPAKFASVYETIGLHRPTHEKLEALKDRPVLSGNIKADLEALKPWLLNRT